MDHGQSGSGSAWRKRLHLWIALALAAASLWVAAQTVDSPSAAVQRYDIPPQPLSSALRQFAQQSRRDLLFTPGLVAGRHSAGVTGSLPSLRALEILLTHTGIAYSTTSAGAILLHEERPPNAAMPAGRDAAMDEEP